jgi:hypothetical protein
MPENADGIKLRLCRLFTAGHISLNKKGLSLLLEGILWHTILKLWRRQKPEIALLLCNIISASARKYDYLQYATALFLHPSR